MRMLKRLAVLSFSSALLVLAQSSWALDVKAGLWEIKPEGMGDPQRLCYTTEMLNEDLSDVPMPPGLVCRKDIKESGSTRIVAHVSCTGTMSMEVDTRIDVQNPESMAMESTSVMTIAGQQQIVHARAQYRWLQADCGDVQPIDADKIFK